MFFIHYIHVYLMGMVLIIIGNGGDFIVLAILGTIAISLLKKGLLIGEYWDHFTKL